MRFELDLLEPPADEKRAVELEHCVEDAIRHYKSDHRELTRQDVQEALRLAQVHADAVAVPVADPTDEPMRLDEDPISFDLSPLVLVLVMVAAAVLTVLALSRA